MRLLLPLLAACTLGVAACGESATTSSPSPSPREQAAGDERVIRGWSDDLRRGDEAAAAARFALPATVANGHPPVKLTTRDAVLAFHDALPCGGVLVAAEPHHGVTIARFRLTERPGGDCGDGVGGYAAAAFEISGGRIVRWLRVEDPAQQSAPPGPQV